MSAISNRATTTSAKRLEHVWGSVISEKREIKWRKIAGEMLDVDYAIVFPKSLGSDLMDELERSVEYYAGDLTRVNFVA